MKLTNEWDGQDAIRVKTMIRQRHLGIKREDPQDRPQKIFTGEGLMGMHTDQSRITRVLISTTDGVGGKLNILYVNLIEIIKILIIKI